MSQKTSYPEVILLSDDRRLIFEISRYLGIWDFEYLTDIPETFAGKATIAARIMLFFYHAKVLQNRCFLTTLVVASEIFT